MGNSFRSNRSVSPPPPTNPPLLDKPWLEMNWGDREADLQFINDYRPKGEDHHQFRILLQGPVGAGKSSFINSVISTLEGKICHRAFASTGQTSFTKEYKMYSIKKGDQGEMYPFVLNDMMGLDNRGRRYRRVYEKDMEMAMKGHIKDGYTFNPEKALSKDNPLHYNQNPTIDDKVHILVSVIDADKVILLGNPVVEIIQDIRDEATELGIPHVAVLTKIDEIHPEIKKDVKKFCRTQELQKKVKDLSNLVGIPENCIFPLKNYHCEMMLNDDINALVLKILRRIIEIGDEKLNN
ncbi:interferon-induced protein 44-like isoform X2 [Gambusia affinis]|nr:interferon-induced protein 44-like isoform X2 [Gambusia affinis]